MQKRDIFANADLLDRLSIFTFLWASQAMVHQQYFKYWIENGEILGAVVTVFAFATFLRPTSLVLLCGLLISSMTATYVHKMPNVPNHIFLEAVIHFIILLAIARTIFVNRKSLRISPQNWAQFGIVQPEQREKLFASFAPILTALLLIVYFFATLHKINSDFLNAQVSCGAQFYLEDLVDRFPFLPTAEWAQNAAIWGTLIMEGGLFLTLAIKRLRPIGFFIGLPMHLIFGIVGHHTFSAFAFALYFLFLSEDFTKFVFRLRDGLQQRFQITDIAKLFFRVRFAAAAFCMVLTIRAIAGYYFSGIPGLKAGYTIEKAIWFLWATLLMAIAFSVVIGKLKTNGLRPTIAVNCQPPLFMWIFVVLVGINGMLPYLGLKTIPCFSMYSNLRTEGENPNHLFMPTLLKIFNETDDLVEIHYADIQRFSVYTEKELYLPYVEFRRRVFDTTEDFSMLYSRNGNPHYLQRINGVLDGDDIPEPLSPVYSKFVYFRPVNKKPLMDCRH